MLYLSYQTQSDFFQPWRSMAKMTQAALSPWTVGADPFGLRRVQAAAEMLSRATLTHTRPAYGISTVQVRAEF